MKKLIVLLPLLALLVSCKYEAPDTSGDAVDISDVLTDSVDLPEVDPDLLLSNGGDTVADYSTSFPIASGWVNDYERLFTQEEISYYTQLIEQHHESTGDEIFLVTAANIHPYQSLEEFTLGLANSWTNDSDTTINSVLIVISSQLEELRIESSDAYDSRFSDEKSSDVIYNTMIPAFAQGHVSQGTELGLREIISYLDLQHAGREAAQTRNEG